MGSELSVKVGNVQIGGGAPVVVQSMTLTPTRDVEATVAQIAALASAGCELVRCAVPKTLPRSRAQRETIDDLVARSNAETTRRPATPARPAAVQQAAAPQPALTLDAILDKISQQGLEALSADERRLLDDHSRRLRDS